MIQAFFVSTTGFMFLTQQIFDFKYLGIITIIRSQDILVIIALLTLSVDLTLGPEYASLYATMFSLVLLVVGIKPIGTDLMDYSNHYRFRYDLGIPFLWISSKHYPSPMVMTPYW